RVRIVIGVQTCALPILLLLFSGVGCDFKAVGEVQQIDIGAADVEPVTVGLPGYRSTADGTAKSADICLYAGPNIFRGFIIPQARSEERRVGKERRSWRW